MVGLYVISDGEFCCIFWYLDFLSVFDGVEEVDVEKFLV